VDVVLSPDGAMLATASLDGTVRFFAIDVETMSSAKYYILSLCLSVSVFACLCVYVCVNHQHHYQLLGLSARAVVSTALCTTVASLGTAGVDCPA